MTLTAVHAGAYLHHLAFESAKPKELAEFYSGTMEMALHQVSDDEWRCEGPRRRMIVKRGTDNKLAFAGFGCRDADAVEDLRRRVEAEGVPLLASPSPYLTEGAFAVQDPDGNTICFGFAGAEEERQGRRAPTQHLTFASFDVEAIQDFYHGKLGFAVSDRVLHEDGRLATSFLRSNHEHHTIACFLSKRQGVDHHSYEAGEWDTIRDWADHFAARGIQLAWGPGRHGPGNNLFIFIVDPDDNWIEVSAELEVVRDRPVKDWPQHPRTLNLWGDAIMRS